MSSEKIKELINRYFDDELDKNEEVFLFTNLSQDEEAREYFKQMNMLSENIKNTVEEFPFGLEEEILSATVSRSKLGKKFSFKIPTVISYAFSIVLLVLSIALYSKSVEYKKDIETNIQQINYQNKMLEMMFNSLPPSVVKAKLENPIIIRPTM